eukprot:COSAG01_NODE_181_length_22873_cov_12.951392_24_plen_63_part_00
MLLAEDEQRDSSYCSELYYRTATPPFPTITSSTCSCSFSQTISVPVFNVRGDHCQRYNGEHS